MRGKERLRGRANAVIWAALVGIVTGLGAGTTHAAEESWAPAIHRFDDALRQREFGAALRAANEGYAVALASQRWEGLIAAGGAYWRLGEATGLRQSFDARAREVYGRALNRARQQASVEGVLHAAEGFVALGDTASVARCVRIADRLAGRDSDAQADVRAFVTRLSDPGLGPTTARP